MLKLKHSFLALAIFMVGGFILSENAHASPVCGILSECRLLQAYLQEALVKQKPGVIREYLQSQLIQVDARIEELPSGETSTGAIFTRDRSHTKLNEAWRDPEGLIWGDVVKYENGFTQYMIQSSEYMKEIGRPLPNGTLGAKEYCESIDARLPSKEEFTRLREYMGARSGTDEGYSAQILPNLSGYGFWSSSVNPRYAGYAYYFKGTIGSFDKEVRGENFGYYSPAVRCVVGR